jgi:hypothetical protein
MTAEIRAAIHRDVETLRRLHVDPSDVVGDIADHHDMKPIHVSRLIDDERAICSTAAGVAAGAARLA